MENQKSKIEKSPIVWILAGSDSGGGAGLQLDLKTMNAFGVHGCTVVTALTAQNTNGVSSVENVSDEMVAAQLAALAEDLPPKVIKTGMLGGACAHLTEYLAAHNTPLVCDPVIQSSSGHALMDKSALDALKHELLPRTTLLTPNRPETVALLGSEQPPEEAADKLLELGPRSVLIKGGHADGDSCRDYWTDGEQAMWLSSPRIDTKDTHGTGCLLASAIAAAIALGHGMREAVIMAKTFLNQCLKSPTHLGAGHGPMMVNPFLDWEEDRPEVKTLNP